MRRITVYALKMVLIELEAMGVPQRKRSYTPKNICSLDLGYGLKAILHIDNGQIMLTTPSYADGSLVLSARDLAYYFEKRKELEEVQRWHEETIAAASGSY
jgi:hypothetical protein